METPFKIPFYAKAALIFISVLSFIYIMQIAQHIIIPILFATIIAILLNPLVNYLIRKKINRLVSISIAVCIAVLAGMGLLCVISSQVKMLSETYPQLKEKFDAASVRLVQWISENFEISKSKSSEWIKELQNVMVTNFAIGDKLIQGVRVIATGMLLPVYLFMILYYKPLLLEFIRKLFRAQHHTAVVEILTNAKKIIQTYLVGLFFELIIIAIMNSVALLLLGINYAIILGIAGAVLNIIPYIGGVAAIALPVITALVTKDSLISPIFVFCAYVLIQFIDNHYIIPKIVASRVKINALISIIVVLIGSAIWGIPGMFLSIPLTAIIKVIFDHIEPLKPWGFLLGNIVPTVSKFSFIKHPKRTMQ